MVAASPRASGPAATRAESAPSRPASSPPTNAVAAGARRPIRARRRAVRSQLAQAPPPTGRRRFRGSTGRGMRVFVEHRLVALDGPDRDRHSRCRAWPPSGRPNRSPPPECRAAWLPSRSARTLRTTATASAARGSAPAIRRCSRALGRKRTLGSALERAPVFGRGAPAGHHPELGLRQPRAAAARKIEMPFTAQGLNMAIRPLLEVAELPGTAPRRRWADGSPPAARPNSRGRCTRPCAGRWPRPPPRAPPDPAACRSGFQLAGPKGKNCGVCAR